MRKNLACWLVIALLVSSLFPCTGVAAKDGNASGQTNATTITLEKAIQNVKQFFPIPKNLNEFSSAFDNSNNRQIWRLEWSSKDGTAGSLSAEVDAANGEICSMHHWRQNMESFSKTPTLSVLEAQKKGQDLLIRLLPGKSADLIFQQESGIVPLGAYDSPQYTMTWQRFYKGIKVAMDNASMTIDMQTGEITDYNVNWTSQSLPDPTGKISLEKASQVFVSQEMLKLQYKLNRSMVIKTNPGVPKPQLVYAVNHPSNGIIDALTGQPLVNQGYGFYNDKSGMGSLSITNLDETKTPAPIVLTPEEQKEIENSSQYLSQEQAVTTVKKIFKISDTMVLQSASLEKNWEDPELRCWNLGWKSKESDNDYLWVQIDAGNGELISFNQTVPATNGSQTMMKEEAQKIAEAFIKNVFPQRWSEIKLSDTAPEMIPMEDKQNSWSFHYLRLVNGIQCPDNGLYVTVDAVMNQVNSFSSNWYRHDFPSSQNVLSKAQAIDKFFAAAPLTLAYIHSYDKKGMDTGIKLVYVPDMKNGFTMLDAITGSSLDATGQPISNYPKAYGFNDIKGHFGEKEITILGQAGVFGEYGDSFHPDENVTLLSLLRAMITSKDGVYGSKNVSDEEIMQRGRQLGWIDESSSPQDNVSREMLAQLMIRYLNIDYLTQVQGIYRVPYQDSADMSPTMQAYAALCWGLGIIKSDGKNFNGNHVSTRAEAAIALVHTLSVKTKP